MPKYEKFPFGKFSGIYISEIPSAYLFYSLENFTLPDELNQEIANILVKRLPLSGTITSDKVNSVFRELSKKYHPDKGGNNEAMKALNDFKNSLISR